MYSLEKLNLRSSELKSSQHMEGSSWGPGWKWESWRTDYCHWSGGASPSPPPALRNTCSLSVHPWQWTMAGPCGGNTEWPEHTAWNIRLGYLSLVAQLVKNPPAMHLGSIPGSGRSPGGGRGNPLQCSCLENPWGQRSFPPRKSWLSIFSLHSEVHQLTSISHPSRAPGQLFSAVF